MTKITPSHLLEATAVQRVQTILSESSALSEVIKNDYGEDLIVQTHNDGMADPFQILVQVKGVKKLRISGSKFTHRFEVRHLIRWVSQLGAVLVCVYDDSTKKVFSFSPSERFTQWDILSTSRKSISVKFTDNDEFNLESVRDKIWQIRINHFSNLLAIAENKSNYLELHDALEENRSSLNREIVILSLSFLKIIKAVVNDEFNDNFRKIIRNGSPFFLKTWNEPNLSLRHIFMFALVGEVNEATNCGVPPNILEQVCEAAGYFYKIYHKEEWKESEKILPLKWMPYRGIE